MCARRNNSNKRRLKPNTKLKQARNEQSSSQSHEESVAVIGAGSWGTALAILLAGNGHSTRLWGRNSTRISEMSASRCNKLYLPDTEFPPTLQPHAKLKQALTDANTILLAVPSKGFRESVEQIKPLFAPNTGIAIATKGLEPDSLKLLHQVVHEVLGDDIKLCIISGPTFAKEVAATLPTAVTVASEDEGFALKIARLLSNDHFRAYTSSDVIGVEVGGAVKNVIAIAAGIADGLGFGANTRTAVITRGLAEISRLGVALGGQQETFMGLAGLGDLVLTCTDDQSRNRRVGLGLAGGKSLEQILAELGQVAEGVETAEKVYHLSQQMQIQMPIVEQVYKVIYEHKATKQAVYDLLHREIRAEN